MVGGGAKRLEGVQPGDYERLAGGLEKVVAIAKARGLKAHYHPHLSTMVEGSYRSGPDFRADLD